MNKGCETVFKSSLIFVFYRDTWSAQNKNAAFIVINVRSVKPAAFQMNCI